MKRRPIHNVHVEQDCSYDTLRKRAEDEFKRMLRPGEKLESFAMTGAYPAHERGKRWTSWDGVAVS